MKLFLLIIVSFLILFIYCALKLAHEYNEESDYNKFNISKEGKR